MPACGRSLHNLKPRWPPRSHEGGHSAPALNPGIAPAQLGRGSRCLVAQGRQPRAYLRDHRQVLLALVALERLLERYGGFAKATGGAKDFGEVGQGITLEVERVRPFDDRDGFVHERLGLGVLSTRRVDERLRLTPPRLSRDVVLVADLAPEPRERLGLVVTAEGAERAAEPRSIGGE